MTKILYIPTGEYLKFCKYGTGFLTTDIEETKRTKEELILDLISTKEAISKTKLMKSNGYLFLYRNKIILPILKEELEITE